MNARTGRLKIDPAGHEINYRLVGDAPETLVCLHGGPGSSMSYLRRLEELADDRLQILLYDQLGGGDSDRPDDDSLWRVERFVAELETIRVSLDLGPVHVFGRSWGAMLGLQYTLDHPGQVRSLVFSSAGASAIQMVRAITQARLALPDHVLRRMMELEAEDRLDDPEYQDMVWEFNGRYVWRATPFEPTRSVREARELLGDLFADHGRPYHVMWGPNEFVVHGNLLAWDVTDRLGEVAVPALVLAGLHDEQGLEAHRVVADGVQDAEFVIFGQSSHLVLLEKEADAYLDSVRGFLRRVMAKASPEVARAGV